MGAAELISGFTRCAGAYLYELLENDNDRALQLAAGGIATAPGGSTTPQRPALTIDPARLFEGVQSSRPSNPDDRDARLVSDFTAHIVREIGNGWVTVLNDSGNGPTTLLTVKGPARPPASNSNTNTQNPAAGTLVPRWDPRTLVTQLLEQTGRWDAVFGGGGYGEMAVSGVGGLGLGRARAGAWEDRWVGDDGFDAWF